MAHGEWRQRRIDPRKSGFEWVSGLGYVADQSGYVRLRTGSQAIGLGHNPNPNPPGTYYRGY